MKQLIRLGCLACLIYLQSCGGDAIKHKDGDTGKTEATSHTKIPLPDATDNLVIKNEKDIVGYWVTAVEYQSPNQITLSIDEINGSAISGHSIIAGVFKPFTGTLEKSAAAYSLTLNHPGVGKYRGSIKMTIAEGDSVLNWPKDTTFKELDPLQKRLFHYDASQKLEEGRYADYSKTKTVTTNDGEGEDYKTEGYLMTTEDVNKYNASTDALTKAEVSNLKKTDITVMRNSIFARHGYAFKKSGLRLYFSQQKWYMPISPDVTAELTALEKKNLALLMRYEKNAKEYYDVFGR